MSWLVPLYALAGTLALGVVVNILTNDAQAWLMRLAEKLVQRAVSRAPASLRERLSEEWTRELQECPGILFKLWYVGSLNWVRWQWSEEKQRTPWVMNALQNIGALVAGVLGVTAFIGFTPFLIFWAAGQMEPLWFLVRLLFASAAVAGIGLGSIALLLRLTRKSALRPILEHRASGGDV